MCRFFQFVGVMAAEKDHENLMPKLVKGSALNFRFFFVIRREIRSSPTTAKLPDSCREDPKFR